MEVPVTKKFWSKLQTVKKFSRFTFLIVSLWNGFPSGNEIIFGQVFDSLLMVKHIKAETTH